MTFEVVEVKAIVQRAVEEKQAALLIEYEELLDEMMRQQFNTFTRFNQDHISSQVKDSEFSYLI